MESATPTPSPLDRRLDPTQPYIWPRVLGKEDQLEDVLYVFTWYATPDDLTCFVCGAGPNGLDGYSWVLDHIPDQLEHPMWGPVWDVRSERSLVHERFKWLYGLCRCTVDAEPEIKIGGVTMRIDEVEYRVRSLNQSMIGIQRDLVAMERMALNLATDRLTAQTAFYGGQRLIRRYAPTPGDLAQMTLAPEYFGMMGGPMVGRLGRVLATISPLIEPALIVTAVALPLISELGRQVEEAQRPMRLSEAYRERLSARERERAWNRYKTPLSGGAR